LPPSPSAADPIPVDYLLHTLSKAMPDDAALVEEAPSHRPAMQKFMPMRGRTVSTPWRAAGSARPSGRGRHGTCRANDARYCLIGDGSAMYSIQSLWTAAQRKLPLTIVVSTMPATARCARSAR